MHKIIFAIALLWSCLLQAKDTEVLVMHSYHKGYYWTDEFQSGIESALKNEQVSYRTVYLDTKRFQSQEYLDELYSIYKYKFSQDQYSAIIVSDNNGLNLLQRLAPVIGDTPVIFSGINGYTPEMHSALNATGITTRVEIDANIELIKRLQPDVDKVFVITEDTISGQAVRNTINAYLENFPEDKALVKHFIPASYDVLREFVSNSPKHSAILFWGVSAKGASVDSVMQFRTRIDDYANAPVYFFHDSGFGYGAVGGYIHNGVSQGKSVIKLLLDILESPNKPLPGIRNATPDLKLDYNAVKKWGLKTNSGDSFSYAPGVSEQRLASQLRYILFALLFLVAIILSLLYYTQKLKASEKRAKQSQILLESIFDKSHQYIGILDEYGRLISCNNKLHNLLFGQGINLERPIWHHKGWEENSRSRMLAYFENRNSDLSIRLDVEVLCQETGCRLLDIVINPLPSLDNEEKQFLFEGTDITSEKLTEQKLVERESKMRVYYEQQPVMMLTLDERNRIQAANRFTSELLGYQDMAILGHYLTDFYIDESSLPARKMLLQPQRAMKDVWRREIRYKHQSGRTLWIRENIRPLDDTGQLLIVGEDITEIHSLTEQLEYQARYDVLTEAFNRNHFEAELGDALKEVHNQLRTHAMLYIDLDQLKVLNDTAGHEAGDSAIKFAASIIESVLPYKAILARMGGDEFAVLLRDCTELDAKKIAKNIINSLASNPFTWDEIVLSLTCSLGIRLIDDTATSTQMVHAHADTACHAAKEEGRNRYHLYHVDDEDLQRRHLEMESVNLVHDALAKDRLELFAQRVISLEEDQEQTYVGFEILVRIRDTNGDFISPGIFMPASEKYNVAHLIDKAVVTKTLSWLESHPEVVKHLGTCAINLSGQSFGNKEFIDYLVDAIEHSSIPGSKLAIEITETAAMGNIDQAIKHFSKIKRCGCKIALDDFGSGLSSFGYLKKLPVDTVKIDGLFVRDMDRNETDYIMVRSINDLAKQMGKKTVAEFVENEQILKNLKELGVDFAQGYVIARPKPLDELISELLPELS